MRAIEPDLVQCPRQDRASCCLMLMCFTAPETAPVELNQYRLIIQKVSGSKALGEKQTVSVTINTRQHTKSGSVVPHV